MPKKEVEDVKKYGTNFGQKGGATPNFVVDQRDEYISNLNWLGNWINVYFFNKVSDYFS